MDTVYGGVNCMGIQFMVGLTVWGYSYALLSVSMYS